MPEVGQYLPLGAQRHFRGTESAVGAITDEAEQCGPQLLQQVLRISPNDAHTLFIAGTFVNDDPDAAQLADIATMAVEEARRFGPPPKVAFPSQSVHGSSRRRSAFEDARGTRPVLGPRARR